MDKHGQKFLDVSNPRMFGFDGLMNNNNYNIYDSNIGLRSFKNRLSNKPTLTH